MKDCPLCNSNNKVFGISPLFEYGDFTSGRKFEFLCEKCRYFFDKNGSGRTY